MEILSFESVLNSLSQMKADLPILDTYFFRDGKLSRAYIQNRMRQTANCDSIQAFIEMKVSELELLGKMRNLSSSICFIHNRVTKSFQQISDIRSLKAISYKTQVIQLPKALTRFYSYSLSISKDGNTTESFSGDSYLLDHIRDITKAIVSYIEMYSHKQVTRISIDFGLENEASLWIYNIANCEIIESFNRSFAPKYESKSKERKEKMDGPSQPIENIQRKNTLGDKYFLEMISKTNVKRRLKSVSHDFDKMVKLEKKEIKKLIFRTDNHPVLGNQNENKNTLISELLYKPPRSRKILHKKSKSINSISKFNYLFLKDRETANQEHRNKLPLLSGTSHKQQRINFRTFQRESSLVIKRNHK